MAARPSGRRTSIFYRDNFFLPPAQLSDGRASEFIDRLYAFGFGRDVRLICLDTTSNEETLPGLTWVPLTHNGSRSEQVDWLRNELATHREAAVKIAYFHHPLFDAARRSSTRSRRAGLLAPLFESGGVRLALSGHVHNFQVARPNGERGTHYVVSGAGGEIERPLDSPEDLRTMAAEGIEATNLEFQPSFVLVEVEGGEVRVFPCTYDPRSGEPALLDLRTPAGDRVAASAGSRYHPIRILPAARLAGGFPGSAPPSMVRPVAGGAERGDVPLPAPPAGKPIARRRGIRLRRSSDVSARGRAARS